MFSPAPPDSHASRHAAQRPNPPDVQLLAERLAVIAGPDGLLHRVNEPRFMGERLGPPNIATARTTQAEVAGARRGYPGGGTSSATVLPSCLFCAA